MSDTDPEAEEHVYLILYGAPSGVRRIRHIAMERDGEQVPRCNTHYVASHDSRPRRFRPVEGREQDYPVCKRCLAWHPYEW